jgi:phage tail tape-measure protein
MAVTKEIFWKQSTATLVTWLAAMVGFWLMVGREYPTRSEVSGMISTEAPYNEDRAMVMKQLTDNTEVTKSLTEAVVALRITIGRLEERLQRPTVGIAK